MNIPQTVAHNCETNPSGSFYIYAEPSSNELVTITQLEFGRATHRAASIVRPQGAGSDGQVVAVIALSDTVLYHAVLVGLMTANLVPFPISPRNSPAGIFGLLRASSCHRIIATCTTLAPLIAAIQQHVAEVDPTFALKIEEIPLLAEVYPNLGVETTQCSFQPYTASGQTLAPSLDDIALYMHSSGSTGFPKAIAQTHRALMGWTTLPPVAEARLYVEKPMANMGLPSFHLFGITCQLLQPLFGTPAAVYPPTATSTSALPVIPTPDNIIEHARKTKCRSLTAVPALLATWSKSPETVAYLATLHTIIWSGGPLPQRVGDRLANAGVHMVSGYGATETGAITYMTHAEEDVKEWAWFQLADIVKVRWVPQGDGTFECQILTSETYAPSVENLPDVRGYAMSDLCVNHPQKKHLWRVIGRIDDAIVHTSGEKTVPAPMEDIVLSSPLVAGAVVFGTERPQTGILVETIPSVQIDVKDVHQVAELRNKIWPIIEEANAIAPAFSRIFKEMVLFSSLNKPLPRAAKGSVLRKAALALYTEEINSIFRAVEDQTSSSNSMKPPSAWEAVILEPWLLELANNVSNNSVISATKNLFEQGFDSLTATIFRLHIIHTLRALEKPVFVRAATAIEQNLVYSRPSIIQLSAYLEDLVHGTAADNLVTDRGSLPQSEEAIVELRTGDGIPLILFPGATGRLPLWGLRFNFTGTLWGLQMTDSTPTTSLAALTAFIVERITEKQPTGPYRLATFSGSSVTGIAVAKLLEESGQDVLQLTFIDHFPLLWTLEDQEITLRDPNVSVVVDKTIPQILQLIRKDPLYDGGSRQLKNLEAVILADAEVIARTKRLAAPLIEFLADFYSPLVERSSSSFTDAFTTWISSVKAPFTVIIAEFGMIHTVPEGLRNLWSDLGAGRCPKSVRQHFIDGVGHYGIFADDRVGAFLEQY
ncbi:Non-canonical non-ribosomal peptide synthetase FUB8 [Mycena sanguinolenta]|uniref:Non-canonical non-ribosomal peptide synthetase FUB8 n=1 Tax=Mycena sanguinolenta TaxID=230812 RepID=A0A8H7DDA0_9AGAR|nr:Non-canonical non-ribosomal peptide synthetase FUB8 [Mycena sanguinolenta]